ncbi:hypothetical protein [Psychromicrobium sp. YIM B11713]|uniref:scabin-related ADP-ribosyltransferase n=1 Tax=Psychromicrobium sp. YIM B11713 TaxID=3145233 RepID=UPI00374F95EB
MKKTRIALVFLVSLLLVASTTSEALALSDPKYPVVSSDAAVSKAPPENPQKFLFRGDSSAPSSTFSTGFIPQGTNPDLLAHLSFRGGSGYVSTSVSETAATSYVYGRSDAQAQTGYLYVIAPVNLNGHFIPDIFPNDGAVRYNQEFAVGTSIPGNLIVGAYTFTRGNSQPTAWTPNPQYTQAQAHPFNQTTPSGGICSAIVQGVKSLCSLNCRSPRSLDSQTVPQFDGVCSGVDKQAPAKNLPPTLEAISKLDQKDVKLLAWGGGSASTWGGQVCLYAPVDTTEVGAWATKCSREKYHGYSDIWKLNIKSTSAQSIKFTLRQDSQCLNNMPGSKITLNSCNADSAVLEIAANGQLKLSDGNHLVLTANTLYWAVMYGYVFAQGGSVDNNDWAVWSIQAW